MGKTYIKEENGHKVLYEENSFFPDTKLGELHENWNGSLETRNSFSENYKLTEDRDELGEIVTCIIPGTLPNDYKVETSDGESGTLKWNNWKERHEFEKEASDHSSYSSNERISYNRGSSSYGSSKSNGWGRRVALGIFSILVGMSVGLIEEDYKKNPDRYSSFFKAPAVQHYGTGNVVQSRGIINNYNESHTKRVHHNTKKRKASQEARIRGFKSYSEYQEHLARERHLAREKLLENAKGANIVEDFQAFQDSTAEPERHQEIVIPEDEFFDLERLIVGMKRKLYADKKETLEAIESTFVANQISEKEKNWYVKIVESEVDSYLANFKTKIIGFEMFPEQQQESLLKVIYDDSLNIDSSKTSQFDNLMIQESFPDMKKKFLEAKTRLDAHIIEIK